MMGGTMLSGGYVVRRPTTEDFESVLALLVASDIAEFGEPDISAEDLRAEWRELDLVSGAWVIVAPGGALAGYAAVDHREWVQIFADVYVHPEHEGRGIGTRLVRLTEARARELVPRAPQGARVTLTNTINGGNEAARRLLEGEGYTLARHFWRMVITMDAPPPAPTWPIGVAVRRFRPGEDERAVYEAVTEAFQDMWGYIPPTFEEWRSFMIEREDFDPSLFFLAVAGDGEDGREEIAGVALCLYRLELGWVRSLAVRRPWRGRGLGMDLLREAFGEFYRRGRREVGLGVDAQSLTGATRLYERAGMRVAREFASYQKELRPGEELSPQAIGG